MFNAMRFLKAAGSDFAENSTASHLATFTDVKVEWPIWGLGNTAW
jgi:hypothetical protein